MNATPPVSQASSPSASVKSLKSGGQAPDFAEALTGAAVKPARKPGEHKRADSGGVGGDLPADGNVSPPAAPPVSAGGGAAPAAAFVAGAAGSTSTPNAPADSGAKIQGRTPGSAAIDAAAPSGPPIAVPPGLTAPNPRAQSALGLGLPLLDPGAGAPGTDASTTGGSPVAAPAAPLTTATAIAPSADPATATALAASAAPAAATAAAATGAAKAAALGVASGVAAKHPMDTAAAAVADTSEASTSGSSNYGAAATPAANAAGAAANAAAAAANDGSAVAGAAAAMSAAATGIVAPGEDASAPDAKSPGMQAENAVPTPLAAAGPAVPAAPVNAQLVSALADAGGSDKHMTRRAGLSVLPGIPGDAAAGAAQSSISPSNVADAAPAPTLKVSAGVDTPEFGQGITDQVTWMVDNNLNAAKLQVNPPQLGPIEVRIALQGGHAQVWLASHSAVTRDALESSSDKLREMLGAQGFGQVSVDISHGSLHERPAYSQPYEWVPPADRSPSTSGAQSTAISVPRASVGALDAYA